MFGANLPRTHSCSTTQWLRFLLIYCIIPCGLERTINFIINFTTPLNDDKYAQIFLKKRYSLLRCSRRDCEWTAWNWNNYLRKWQMRWLKTLNLYYMKYNDPNTKSALALHPPVQRRGDIEHELPPTAVPEQLFQGKWENWLPQTSNCTRGSLCCVLTAPGAARAVCWLHQEQPVLCVDCTRGSRC